MIGRCTTSQGIDERETWHRMFVDECLLVAMQECNDRVEVPEGLEPRAIGCIHLVFRANQANDRFSGYRPMIATSQAQVLLEHDGDCGLAVGRYGNGRAMAFASDSAPHWAPYVSHTWEYVAPFWPHAPNWLARNA